MIISASRRTDIPAFYSGWFMKRIQDGYFFNVNPFNPKQVRGVSLLPEDVTAIVFWSKYPAPLFPHLKELDERGYKYYFLYTVNGYDHLFEPEVPVLEKRIEVFQKISDRIGQDRVIWRYDPVIVSIRTTVDFHLARFEKISGLLAPFTRRVIISFLDFYGKTERKLKMLNSRLGLEVSDITRNQTELLELCRKFKEIAEERGLEIRSCGEMDNSSRKIIAPGSCIDSDLIENITGKDLSLIPDPNQREGCLCARAVDMGMYNTCRFFCTYCYATLSKKAVLNNIARHDPESSVLIGSCQKKFYRQTSLF